MKEIRAQAAEAAKVIGERLKIAPKVGIILGTGLGNLAKRLENSRSLSYEAIPYFPRSTVASHAGQMTAGTLAGQPVAIMEGRFHFYEGYTLAQVTFPVRVFRALGASALIVTNACGGLNHRHERGDILVIEDHINLMGVNPLVGPNDDALGPRFPDMCAPYDPDLMRLAEAVALRHGIRSHRGVYAAMTGPSLETRAEYRMLRLLGADAIGMSTVPEAIVAVHAGLRALGLGVITDLCLPDALQPVKIEEIIAVANAAGPKLEQIIVGVLAEARL